MCSGVSGNRTAVGWYVAPSGILRVRGAEAVGYYSLRRHAIVLAQTDQLDGGVVRHEMVHALLHGRGHPRDIFLGRCGGWVACGACVAATDRPRLPDGAISLLSADSGDVSVEIVPARPSASLDGGHFSIVLGLRNASPSWRRVHLPTPLSGNIPKRCALDAGGSMGGVLLGVNLADVADTLLAPGEVKHCVFDLRVGDSVTFGRLPGGTYTARGAVTGIWSRAARFQIGA